MNKEYKEIEVVMLETEYETHIIEDKGLLEFIPKKQIANSINSSVKGFHLYFLSDEPLQMGDWCLCESIEWNNHRPESAGIWIDPIRKWSGGDCQCCKKIIATTDSLAIAVAWDIGNGQVSSYEEVPKPKNSFIEEYIRLNIKKVNVEFKRTMIDCPDGITDCEVFHCKEELVINNDNTINIEIPKEVKIEEFKKLIENPSGGRVDVMYDFVTETQKYAKQEAIDFADWIFKSWAKGGAVADNRSTTEELYDMYKRKSEF